MKIRINLKNLQRKAKRRKRMSITTLRNESKDSQKSKNLFSEAFYQDKTFNQ